MAIAYDTAGSAVGNGVSTRTVSLAATGSDRIAILVVRWFSGTHSTVTVTVDGNAVTQIGSTYEYTGDTRFRVAMYRYLAPPTSAVNYVATWPGNVDDAGLGVVTYTGVDQTTPINGSLGTAEGSSTGPSLTISSATGELVVATANGMYPANSLAEDAGQTERIYQAPWGGNGNAFSVCEEAGAASVTQSWTQGNSARWVVLAARLAEASAGGGSRVNLIRGKLGFPLAGKL